MAEQYTEQILIRRILNYDEAPNPIVDSADLGENYEFRGIIQLKRICNNDINSDTSDKCIGIEYVFDVVSVNKFDKQ